MTDPALGALLERLYAETDWRGRLAADPVAFPHRYERPEDREIAAAIAASLAFGRVAAFRPVLDAVFALADARGGPEAYVRGFTPARDGEALARLYYRWVKGDDLVLWMRTLGAAADAGSLERLVVGETLVDGLDALVEGLRGYAVAVSARRGKAPAFEVLPRGFRTLLPRPADGSACKRWWMFLRWMVRKPIEGVDLGLWTGRRPAELLVPLDTHVLRIARFLGLTARTDDSGRTAAEVTAALRRYDPDDPVRFDFAIAHLGISGACRGKRDAAICPGCALTAVCTAPGPTV